MTDYIAQCNCRFEVYAKTLVDIKKQSRKHIKSYDSSHEIYIDREKDFGSGPEIDDSFKSVVITKKRRKAPKRS